MPWSKEAVEKQSHWHLSACVINVCVWQVMHLYLKLMVGGAKMIERQEMRRLVILMKNSLHVCAAAGTPAPHHLISESCDARLKLSAHLHFASFLSIHSYTSACSARSSATRSCQVHRHSPLPFPPASVSSHHQSLHTSHISKSLLQ